MTADKTNNDLKMLTDLIVDGNKDISDKLNLVLSDLGYVKSDISKLNNKIDTVETNLKKEVKLLDDTLKLTYKMLSHDIAEVDKKLDMHLPAEAGLRVPA